MNRNETKIGKSHFPTSIVQSHLTSQKKNKFNIQTPTNPRTYAWWEFGWKMYVPWFSFFWGMRDEFLFLGPDTNSSFSHHLFLSPRKELEEKNPKFSLPLPLGLRQYETCYCPKPGQKHTEIVIYVTEKKSLPLIQHLSGTEKLHTAKKPASLFHLAPFPRKLPLPHLCFTQRIPCSFITSMLGWVNWQRKDKWYNSKGRWILLWPDSETIYNAFALSNIAGHEPAAPLLLLVLSHSKKCHFTTTTQFQPWLWKQHSAKPHLENFTHFEV